MAIQARTDIQPYNAWLDPKGRLHPVDEWGHEDYAAQEMATEAQRLEWHGWIRLSEGIWQGSDVTQAQLNAIWDWHVALGLESDFRPRAWNVK